MNLSPMRRGCSVTRCLFKSFNNYNTLNKNLVAYGQADVEAVDPIKDGMLISEPQLRPKVVKTPHKPHRRGYNE